tara:strand:+ start:582 stop:686 length:105 start_codon:yes stop_codon:yes gene_type:complete
MKGKIDETKKLQILDEGKKMRINQNGSAPIFNHI